MVVHALPGKKNFAVPEIYLAIKSDQGSTVDVTCAFFEDKQQQPSARAKQETIVVSDDENTLSDWAKQYYELKSPSKLVTFSKPKLICMRDDRIAKAKEQREAIRT